MSVSPIANRSFLHGDRKPSPSCEKIVYATLDSLALKRATLPLQLVPVDDGTVPACQTTSSKEEKKARDQATARKSTFKVGTTALSSKKRAKYLLVVSPTKSGAREIRSDDTEKECSSAVEQAQENPSACYLRRARVDIVDTDNNDIDAVSIRVAKESDTNAKADVCEHFYSRRVESAGGNRDSPNKGTAISSTLGDDGTDGSDYEKIETTFAADATWNSQKEADEKVSEKEERGGRAARAFVKSKSTNDLASKSCSDSKLAEGRRVLETFSEEKLTQQSLYANELVSFPSFPGFPGFPSCEKKKKRFAKNVLHLVPEYLVKGPKRRRQKKKSGLGGSLSSLKALSVESKAAINCSTSSRYRSRSLSREEMKKLEISSPTNFVHVASATNLSLFPDQNPFRYNSEQLVITHEQKCAILPLLVAPSENSTAENGAAVATKSPDSLYASSKLAAASKETPAHKNGALDLANLKRELVSELEARTAAKALETSQQVKRTHSVAKVREKKPPNKVAREWSFSSSGAEPPANSSFLWSSRVKSLLETRINPKSEALSSANENAEDVDSSEYYDDVGLSGLIEQEDAYDDVGMPASGVNRSCVSESPAIFQDPDDIYDDVVGPRYPETASAAKRTEIGASERKEREREREESWMLVSNEYSSVDEDEEDEEEEEKEEDEDADAEDTLENDEDVYDDVGLPSEEQVNSLYAGSTTRSISGSTWMNGKESEWEDLEDSTAVALRFLAGQASLPAETSLQAAASRKKAGQRWSRKTRRQRTRGSRKNLKSPSMKPVPHETTVPVAVSLGSGSVLLVGCGEKIEEWKKQEREDRTAEENAARTQGLVQMRVIDLDEDVDTQEASCYVHEDTASDDSTYESLHSFQPDDFSTDSETEKMDEMGERECESIETEAKLRNGLVIAYLEAPTRPNPPPPRELSLTQTLGRRIKMLRRTWSITKGSLGRMRRRTSVDDEHSCEESKESSNDHSNADASRYFSFARHFRKSVAPGPLSTFYLNGYTTNGNDSSTTIPRASYDEQIAPIEEPAYSNAGSDVDHYSVLMDQEPLYQFYAEAVARVAFDSNSESYEEVTYLAHLASLVSGDLKPQVERMSPSRVTTDLGKPGHRTLWCQTPQVIASGLLQRLTPEEKRIQEAKFEILTSEASYLNSLRVLKTEFLDEPSVHEMLTPIEKEKLFGGIASVLQKSEQFLAELEAEWKQDVMLQALPDVLLKFADRCLNIYVTYCSNQVSRDETLKDLRSRKGSKFAETISQIEARSACQSLSLSSFLILPMQRITRFPLLADAVLSKLPVGCDDRSRWERVLTSVNYVVTECNEGARAAIKLIEMENLARKLEYSANIKPMVLKGKQLVKSGSVVQLSTKADTEYKLTFGRRLNKTPLYLLLLTDYLLVSKHKSNTQSETYTVIDTCKRSLITLESVAEDSPFAGRNAMLLTLLENHSGHQVEYVLTCESDTERQRWLEAVSPSKQGLIGETLYEVWDCPQVVALYCYPPNQPDELSLHPGDVINVFRKMSDGWYQGEKLLNGEQGWFPGNYAKEVASEHVRAKNLKQRHRFLALKGNESQRRAKQ